MAARDLIMILSFNRANGMVSDDTPACVILHDLVGPDYAHLSDSISAGLCLPAALHVFDNGPKPKPRMPVRMSGSNEMQRTDSLLGITLRYGGLALVLALVLLLVIVSDVSSQEESQPEPPFIVSSASNGADLAVRLRSAELAAAQEARLRPLRQIYREADAALAEDKLSVYHSLRDALDDYPPAVYLDYRELHRRLAELPFADVDAFLEAHTATPLGDLLQREWVRELLERERWAEAIAYFDINNSNVVLSCRVLWAALQAGDDSVLEQVPALWSAGRSQPNDCDPLFAAWLESGGLTDQIAWLRFSRSMAAGQTGLARYVAGLMSAEQRRLADAWLQIDERPERLRQHSALEQPGAHSREIIRHGVRRLAGIDAPRAMLVLQEYHQGHRFDEQWLIAEQQFVALRLLLQGFVSETESLLRNSPELLSETLVGWILRDALRDHDWPRVVSWLDRLPAADAASERWTYWRARALEQQGGADALRQADALYREVAATRSYYGFLSAEHLDQAPAIIDLPVLVEAADIMALYERPGVLRALELFRLGEDVNARSEWQYATRGLDEAGIKASGELAASWGWHRNSIQAMIQVAHWDDLSLRFPLAYAELFAEAAQTHQVSPPFLKAVSRQESAFMHDVQSPAGARGLMQLMPGTARQTAATLGLQVSTADLYQPEINIALGSRYMAELLETFDNNRILAAAAYNAGPNRVRQWLQRSREKPMPADMWVETIPFLETRGYVQNVLAYNVIFGYRMDSPQPMLTAAEAAARF